MLDVTMPFIDALDQQIRVMSLPNKGRELGQRQARNKLLPSSPDQRLLFVRRKFPERLSRKIRCNCSIEFPLRLVKRASFALALGWGLALAEGLALVTLHPVGSLGRTIILRAQVARRGMDRT